MINALGLLEVYGLVAGMEAADAALKSANVRIINYAITQPGMVTLVFEGDLAACRAALDAGSAAASKLGHVVCRKEMGRPHKNTEWFVQSFTDKDEGKKTKPKPEPKTEEKVEVKTEASKAEVKTEVIAEKKVTLQNIENAVEKIVEAKEKSAQPVKDKVTDEQEPIIEFLQKKASKGANLTDMAKHLSTTTDDVKQIIHQYVTKKVARKKNNRYYMIEDK